MRSVVVVGSLSAGDSRLVQLLLEVGKAPLGLRGEFAPTFYLETADREKLPAGITMYMVEKSRQEEWRHMSNGTIVLLLQPTNELQRAVVAKGARCCVLSSSPGAEEREGWIEVSSAAQFLNLIYET